MKNRIIIATLVLGAQAAQAQKQSTTEMNPVVITGTGTYHRVSDSPVAVRVISAKELRDAHATTLQEALSKLTPNITTHTNGMGTFVNFGGVSDDYMVILVNGKRVSGDDRWNRISLANVRRVEIFSGAASALYGSDAIAGVINIITDDTTTPLTASSTTTLKNNGRFTEDINIDATKGDFSSHTSYTYRHADNWQVNNYEAFKEGNDEVLKLTGRPMSAGFTSNNISEKLEWRIDPQWSVYIRGDYYKNKTERPQSAQHYTQKKQTDGTYNYTAKQSYTYDIDHRSYTYGGGARWTPNSRIHVYADVYSDNFVSKYAYWQTATNEAYDETRKRTHYVNESLRGIFRLASWNKLTAGVEFIQESLNSQSDNIDFETTNTYNLYAQDEVKIVRGLEGVVGLRFTQNSNFGAAVTPNVGLFYHIGGFRVRANYAGGYRTPTLSQLYATDQTKTSANVRYTLNNRDLKPERNHFVSLNLEYSNHWMSASVTGFNNQIRDMINYRTMSAAEIAGSAELTALQAAGWTTIRQRDNIDKARLTGVSTQVKFLIPGGVTIGGGYTFTDSKAETKSLNKTTQQYEITESPVDKSVKHVGNVLVAYDHTWGRYSLNATINGHLQGERYSSTYGYADACSQWDLTTRHTFRLPHFTLEPGIGIENIFNQRDESPWNSNFSTITPGRSFLVSLRLIY